MKGSGSLSGGGRAASPAPSSAPREWYRFSLVKGENGEAELADIYIFDVIGDWIDDWLGWGGVTTAKTFLEELKALPDSVRTLRLHVNSPGGDVFSAVTIANMLRAQSTEKKRSVEVSIEGLAASAATIITSAGDTIRIAENALMMIHNPWTYAVGDAPEMRKVLDELDKVRGQIITTYQWHSELSAEELGEMMDAVTWMDAEEAVANGFATEVTEAMKAAAVLHPRVAAKLGGVPEKFRDRVKLENGGPRMATDPNADPAKEPTATDPAPANPADPANPNPPADPEAPPAAARRDNVVDITEARATEIRKEERGRVAALTRSFAAVERSHPHLAGDIRKLRDAAVEDGRSVEAASRALVDLIAASAGDEIHGAVSPLEGTKPAPTIDAKAIYAKLNGRTAAKGK